jgi:hypothetical protein
MKVEKIQMFYVPKKSIGGDKVMCLNFFKPCFWHSRKVFLLKYETLNWLSKTEQRTEYSSSVFNRGKQILAHSFTNLLAA